MFYKQKYKNELSLQFCPLIFSVLFICFISKTIKWTISAVSEWTKSILKRYTDNTSGPQIAPFGLHRNALDQHIQFKEISQIDLADRMLLPDPFNLWKVPKYILL